LPEAHGKGAKDYQINSKISGVPKDASCESQTHREKQVWLDTVIKGFGFLLHKLLYYPPILAFSNLPFSS
jgi:hypothetical protein